VCLVFLRERTCLEIWLLLYKKLSLCRNTENRGRVRHLCVSFHKILSILLYIIGGGVVLFLVVIFFNLLNMSSWDGGVLPFPLGDRTIFDHMILLSTFVARSLLSSGLGAFFQYVPELSTVVAMRTSSSSAHIHCSALAAIYHS
jgi:hypothetical protein